MTGRFHRIAVSDDKLHVGGPFDPEQSPAKKASVAFLIVQGEGRADTVIVEGRGSWSSPDTFWSGDARVQGKRADGRDGRLDPDRDEGKVRGIAMAVATRLGEKIPGTDRYEAPFIDTVTWCADTVLAPGTAD